MPVMALFRSTAVDQSRYDAIIQELDLERQPLRGILTHACGFDGNEICVVDVWDSREEFEAFLSDRLRPAFAKLNIDFSEPRIIETYAFSASEDVDRFKAERGPSFGTAAADEPGLGPAH